MFRVKSRGKQLALKRMAVNNDNDLYLARQEIAILVSSKEYQCLAQHIHHVNLPFLNFSESALRFTVLCDVPGFRGQAGVW